MIHVEIVISRILILPFLFFGIVFLSFFSYSQNVFGALSCSVTTTCNSPGVVLYKMSATSNAHAEVPGSSNYTQLVCCTGGAGIGNSCSGTFVTILKLSASTNAHVQQNDQSGYANSVCLSNTLGTVSVGYQSTNCTGFDTTVGSMSAVTNAQVADGNGYTTKICASEIASSLTFSVDSSSQSFGILNPGSLAATTSILTAKTTNNTGFTISAARDDADTTLDLDTDAAVNISDKTAWSAPIATTTVGNSTASTTQPQTLQFRIRSLGTDAPNYASVWWGSADTTAGALFAGFPSTSQTIVNRSTAAQSTTTAYVLYNLAVPTTQKTGSYSGSITYTLVANP